MTGMTVKGKEKQVILPNLYYELQSSLEKNSSMSYREIAYDRGYTVVLWWIPFAIWCVDASHFLGESVKDERRMGSFKTYWITISVWMDFDYTNMHNDSTRIMKYQVLWTHIAPLSSYQLQSKMNYFNRAGSPRVILWLPGTTYKEPMPKVTCWELLVDIHYK